jgi:hypothetical protein
MQFGILWPTIALVALIFIVWATMFWQRFAHMKNTPPGDADFADGAAAMRYFAPVEMPANNFRNLFEAPVLYFALVPLLLVTHQANHIQVILAWIYVVLRAAHSFVHIGPKKVPLRFLLYAASCAVLLAMWIGFAVDACHAQAVIDSVAVNELI